MKVFPKAFVGNEFSGLWICLREKKSQEFKTYYRGTLPCTPLKNAA